MAITDLLDRSVTFKAAGREFVMRPVTLLGAINAQAILRSADTGSSTLGAALGDLAAARDSGDAGEVAVALGKFYVAVLESLGLDRLAQLFSLVCEPSDPAQIMESFGDDGILAFVRAAADLHDFNRILARWATTAEPPEDDADDDGTGPDLSTYIVDMATELPQYTFANILSWPYERFLTVQAQIGLLRRLRSGEGDESTQAPPQANPVEMAHMLGSRVSLIPPEPS